MKPTNESSMLVICYIANPFRRYQDRVASAS